MSFPPVPGSFVSQVPRPTGANQYPLSNSSDKWTLAQLGTIGGNTYNASWDVGVSDLGGEALYNSSSAGTATIPMGLTTIIGESFAVRQVGTGSVSIAAGSGVTVNGVTVAAGQYQVLFARQTAADTWIITGTYGSGSSLALPSVASLMPAWMPSSAISENLPRVLANGGDSNQSTGVPFYFPGPTVPAGISAQHVHLYVSGTAAVSQTHAWLALCDLNRKVLAVSADALTVPWDGNSTFTAISIALNAALVPTEDTPTIAVICQTAATLTTFRGYNGSSAIGGGITPYLSGSSNSTQQAPPSVGATITAITSGGSSVSPYCWLTS